MDTVAKYEILYIIRPDIGDDQKQELIKKFDAVLTNNDAEIEHSDFWDKNRKFAYEIEDYTEGDYYLVNFESTKTDAVNEFDRLARINNDILRHMVIRLDHLED
ncbi:MAG: 30S ribosomal protein S6 [Atopostipes suicloacalis]|nr:30S ribosomal protein S6 [Atopostipes suicloacalis]